MGISEMAQQVTEQVTGSQGQGDIDDGFTDADFTPQGEAITPAAEQDAAAKTEAEAKAKTDADAKAAAEAEAAAKAKAEEAAAAKPEESKPEETTALDKAIETAGEEQNPEVEELRIAVEKMKAQQKGLLKDLQDERARRQAAEQTVKPQSKPQEVGPTTLQELIDSGELDADDIPTAKHYALLEKNRLARDGAQKQQGHDTAVEQAARGFEAKAIADRDKCRTELAESATGKSLDFDTVITIGEPNLSPADQAAILKSERPMLEAYQRCIRRTPELLRLQLATAKKPAAEPGKSNQQQPTKRKEPAVLPAPGALDDDDLSDSFADSIGKAESIARGVMGG